MPFEDFFHVNLIRTKVFQYNNYVKTNVIKIKWVIDFQTVANICNLCWYLGILCYCSANILPFLSTTTTELVSYRPLGHCWKFPCDLLLRAEITNVSGDAEFLAGLVLLPSALRRACICQVAGLPQKAGRIQCIYLNLTCYENGAASANPYSFKFTEARVSKKHILI